MFLGIFAKYKMNQINDVLERKGIKQKWLAEELCKSYNMINSYAQTVKLAGFVQDC